MTKWAYFLTEGEGQLHVEPGDYQWDIDGWSEEDVAAFVEADIPEETFESNGVLVPIGVVENGLEVRWMNGTVLLPLEV